jgi:endonuclease/exonuclease/phosphatase (EEP) superfamily protein YafD
MDKKMRIAGVHPLPPASKRGFDSRNQFFENLRNNLDQEKTPVLVVGDLNCSPWSANIDKVLLSKKSSKELNLQDSFGGLFRPHTWKIFGGLLSVPIDYILFSPHLVIKSAEVGPDLGSDHLPLIVSF